MTDVLTPISFGPRSPREALARAAWSTGFGWLVAAWVSIGLWAGLISVAAGLLSLFS